MQAAAELVESWFLDYTSGRPKDAGKTIVEAVAYVIKEREDEIRRKVLQISIGTEKDALESMRKYHDVLDPMVAFLKSEFNVVSLRAVKTEMLTAYLMQRLLLLDRQLYAENACGRLGFQVGLSKPAI